MPSADLQQQATGKVNCGAESQLLHSQAQTEVAGGGKDSSTLHVCFVQHLASISPSQSQCALLAQRLTHLWHLWQRDSFYGVLCLPWETQKKLSFFFLNDWKQMYKTTLQNSIQPWYTLQNLQFGLSGRQMFHVLSFPLADYCMVITLCNSMNFVIFLTSDPNNFQNIYSVLL